MSRLSVEIITIENTYEFLGDIKSLSFSGQDRSDSAKPSWGIKSNSGTLEMYDNKGIIDELKSKGILANSEIKIYLNVANRKEQIGGFYVSNAYRDSQTLKTKIEFQDVLMSWEEKQMPIYLYLYYPRSINADYILNDIIGKAGATLEYATEETKKILKGIYIPYPIIEKGSLWSQITALCELSSCYIYCNDYGIPTIYYGGGA